MKHNEVKSWEESLKRITKNRKVRVIAGGGLLAVSLIFLEIGTFAMLDMLNISLGIGVISFIFAVILFTLGLYFIIYHPPIEVEEE